MLSQRDPRAAVKTRDNLVFWGAFIAKDGKQRLTDRFQCRRAALHAWAAVGSDAKHAHTPQLREEPAHAAP